MKFRGWIGFIGVLAAVTSVSLAPPAIGAVETSRIEVKQLDMGLSMSEPGLKFRLTLQTGQAVEFRTEDPAQAEAALRMAEIFLSNRGRMFAEIQTRGSVVHGLQIAGPAR